MCVFFIIGILYLGLLQDSISVLEVLDRILEDLLERTPVELKYDQTILKHITQMLIVTFQHCKSRQVLWFQLRFFSSILI